MLTPETNCLLIKPDGLETPAHRAFISETLEEHGLSVARSEVWRLSDADLLRLRRNSLDTDYFDRVREAYTGQIHELLVLTSMLEAAQESLKLFEVRKLIRRECAEDFLINAVHVSDSHEKSEDFVLFETKAL